MRYEIGIDVGGTFTDGVILDSEGVSTIVKVPTVPSNPSEAIFDILSKGAKLADQRIDMFLRNIKRLSYGTTSATNLLIEQKMARTGLLITRGFADTLRIANMGREYLGVDLNCDRFAPLLSRRQIWEITERIDRAGDIIIPASIEDVMAGTRYFKETGIEAVAICFLWGFKNPVHENKVAETVKQSMPGTFISVAHEVAPILGEYERCVATVMNAMLGPPVSRDFRSLRTRLREVGVGVDPQILQSAGGVVPLERAISFPVSLIGSGPAGGVTAAVSLGRDLGIPNLICGDMGGTSFDVCLIRNGVADSTIKTRIIGHTLASPMVDVLSIGAGGGSIAWVDGGQRLKVGPRSAGSVPGPVCYGRGGQEPTVTDANLTLGRLNPEGLIGGDLPLDAESAARVIEEKVARPLGITSDEAALGICAIVDNNMANAIRAITVQKGIDPRDFVMVAYGGAAPLHVASLADDLRIPEVIVPFFATVFSAYGAVTSDVVHSLTKNLSLEISSLDELTRCFVELEDEGRRLLEAGGFVKDSLCFRRSAEIRYVGQSHEVPVQVPASIETVEQLYETFERTYAAQYGAGSTHPGSRIEVITARLDAAAGAPKREVRNKNPDGSIPPLKGYRRVIFSRNSGQPETPLYQGESLNPGDRVRGGAIIEYYGTTVFVPLEWSADVDPKYNLRLRRQGKR
ncbi:MAG: hydantoinase/oxoprolinase family protein [Deltaproteobacteria bacterium]|nr:hydantoinase/oxoprolinase family protein [Deltaproteobacteria bacterium]